MLKSILSVTFTKIPSYKGEGNDSRQCSLLSAKVYVGYQFRYS